jgi:serine-type D-Ala-D-Ala carboxypeptidase
MVSLAKPGYVQRERFFAAYSVLEDAIRSRAFPGCAFGVLYQDEIVLLDALGNFTYDEGSREVTPDTIYDIASVTKVVCTTASAMLLYQQGRLDLDTPVGDLLPGFVIGKRNGIPKHRVTLRMLLAHSSGLPGYVRLFETATTPRALFQACLELPLEAEPGTRSEYSDIGFILLGKALEVLLGEPLGIFAQREIFTPLGLESTHFCPPGDRRTSIPPTEEDTTFRFRILQGEVQDEHCFLLQGCAGHAGLFSSVPDLLNFSQTLLVPLHSDGVQEGSPFFHRETIHLFSVPQPPTGSSRALGWDTPSHPSSSGQYFSTSSIGHLGYSGTSLWVDLERSIAVVLLTNRTWPDRQSQQIRQVRPAFHDAVMKTVLHPSTFLKE